MLKARLGMQRPKHLKKKKKKEKRTNNWNKKNATEKLQKEIWKKRRFK